MVELPRKLSPNEVFLQGLSLLRSRAFIIVLPLFLEPLLATLVNIIFTGELAPLRARVAQLIAESRIGISVAPDLLPILIQILVVEVIELLVLVFLIYAFWSFAFKVAYNVSFAKPLDFVGSILPVVRKLPSLLVAGSVSAVLTGLGLLALIGPGVILAIMFSMIIPSVILENSSGFEALSRSRQLVHGRWVQILIVFAGFSMIAAIVILSELFIIPSFVTGLVYALGVAPLLSSILAALLIALMVTQYKSLLVKERNVDQLTHFNPPGIGQVPVCKNCGGKLHAGSTYCLRCGARV